MTTTHGRTALCFEYSYEMINTVPHCEVTYSTSLAAEHWLQILSYRTKPFQATRIEHSLPC
jgi:hypothetical protein